MREIKFRAWLTKEKRMVETGSLINLKDEQGIRIWPYGENPKLNFQQGRNCEVMQYTGLKDKNGKEIYEGDVLKYWGGVDEVSFRHGCFQIKHSEDDWFDIPVDADIEVLGNIYEHPELLKK